jgi:hypothetical protein
MLRGVWLSKAEMDNRIQTLGKQKQALKPEAQPK